MAFVTGIGDTRFGRLEGETTLTLMAAAAAAALADAGIERKDVDGLLCGYSTTFPHLMLATVFAEYFGLAPGYAHAVQQGGATGCAMAMLAKRLVESRQCRHVLVVAGENRLTGQSRDRTVESLAQVGHPDYELPFGPTIPAYYGLVARRYMHEHRVREADLAGFAVLMRRNASRHPKAHLRDPVTEADVLASRAIAAPLKLLDCCPISDGGAAFMVSAAPTNERLVRIAGAGQATTHQHVSAAPSLTEFGAGLAASRAFAEAGVAREDIDLLAIYDSFTITVLAQIEEIGFAPRGKAAALLREGVFEREGRLPLNTHGGLLSFGHCGCAGGMAHLLEAERQLTGRAEARQARERSLAFVHGDGGVLSAHVSLVLERT
jgi:acetyl-CoA acetyltransferase